MTVNLGFIYPIFTQAVLPFDEPVLHQPLVSGLQVSLALIGCRRRRAEDGESEQLADRAKFVVSGYLHPSSCC